MSSGGRRKRRKYLTAPTLPRPPPIPTTLVPRQSPLESQTGPFLRTKRAVVLVTEVGLVRLRDILAAEQIEREANQDLLRQDVARAAEAEAEAAVIAETETLRTEVEAVRERLLDGPDGVAHLPVTEREIEIEKRTAVTTGGGLGQGPQTGIEGGGVEDDDECISHSC
eukprot:GILJ01005384.1.p2 GENE.GILJ01005384.1~~GILJ01005384.1.p2  ORF type:complete len:168 (+),score=9.08 GILJ01005384.1:379-882(+)